MFFYAVYSLTVAKRSRDGIMQYPEFRELLQCLTYWQRTFMTYDQNRSNFMEAHELGRCILENYGTIAVCALEQSSQTRTSRVCVFARVAGYKLSQQAMTTVLKRYSRAMDDGRVLISFEDFVALSVRLRAYTGPPHKIQNAHRIIMRVCCSSRSEYSFHFMLCRSVSGSRQKHSRRPRNRKN